MNENGYQKSVSLFVSNIGALIENPFRVPLDCYTNRHYYLHCGQALKQWDLNITALPAFLSSSNLGKKN